MSNVEEFGHSMCQHLFNLKELELRLYDIDDIDVWESSEMAGVESTLVTSVINAVRYIVDHFQYLVSLRVMFNDNYTLQSPCFLSLIRKQLALQPFSRPYRLRCHSEMLLLWL